MVQVSPDHKKQLNYPFILIDRILNENVDSNCVLKNISQNEWCIARGQTEDPVFPMCMLIECMIQAAGMLEEKRHVCRDKQIFLLSMKKIHIHELPTPGMQLIITTNQTSIKKFSTWYKVEIKIENRCIAKGDFEFANISQSRE